MFRRCPTIWGLVACLTLAMPLVAIAQYLRLPDGSYLKVPEGATDAQIPRYNCAAYSMNPSWFFNQPPLRCGEHMLDIVEKYAERNTFQVFPLPDGTWYALRDGQTVKAALCDAYKTRPQAFADVHRQVEQLGCKAPIGAQISRAVSGASGRVDAAVNSMRGLSSGDACIEKYIGEVRLPDARKVLSFACYFGYESAALDGVDNKANYRAASRCVVAGVDRLFSFEATLSLINSCTRSMAAGAEIFQTFRRYLYADQEEAQRKRDRALVELSQRGQTGVVDSGLILMNTRNGLVTCLRMGQMLDCF